MARRQFSFPTLHPWEFVDYRTGRFLGRCWYRMEEGVYDEIEVDGTILAKVNGCEVDLISCGLDSEGNIVSRERDGIRFQPGFRHPVSERQPGDADYQDPVTIEDEEPDFEIVPFAPPAGLHALIVQDPSTGLGVMVMSGSFIECGLALTGLPEGAFQRSAIVYTGIGEG